MGEWDNGYDSAGFAGSVILAVSLLPQICLAHKRHSTEDISYVWQAVYIAGLVPIAVYDIHYELWPVFYPMVLEFACIVYLTCLKMYYEVFLARSRESKVDDDDDGDGAEFVRPKLQRRMSSKVALEALSNDMFRGQRIGRMSSKLSLGPPSNVSRSRMGASAKSSLGNISGQSSASVFKPALNHGNQTHGVDALSGEGSGTIHVVAGDEQV